MAVTDANVSRHAQKRIDQTNDRRDDGKDQKPLPPVLVTDTSLLPRASLLERLVASASLTEEVCPLLRLKDPTSVCSGDAALQLIDHPSLAVFARCEVKHR